MRKIGNKNYVGFTVLELLIAVGIIGLIAAIAIPSFYRFKKDAERSEAVTMLMNAYRAQADVKHQVQAGRFDNYSFEFTEFFDPPNSSTPALGFRPSGASKYNLILGGNECGGIVGGAYSLDAIGFDVPSPHNSLFGGKKDAGFSTGCAPNEFALGAERLVGGRVDLLVIDEKGFVNVACDLGDRIQAGADMIAEVSNGQEPSCQTGGAPAGPGPGPGPGPSGP